MSKLTILLIVLLSFAVALGAAGLGVAYFETRTLQGSVTDEKGNPISKAVVTLAGRSTFSDAQGLFEIQFPRGDWDLNVFAEGFRSSAQTIHAAAWQEQNLSAAFQLKPLEWRARVLAGNTREPLASARVEFDGMTLATNPQGEFVAFGVRNGTQIQVSQPGYRTTSITVQASGDAAQTTTISLAPTEMRVTVVDASNKKPLPGVRVRANGSTANTDVHGVVVLRGLTEGTSISAQAPGYAELSVDAAQDSQVTLELQPTTLQGQIVDPTTNRAISNAILLWSGTTEPVIAAASSGSVTMPSRSTAAPSLLGSADGDGTFSLEDFSAVPKLYVKKPGYLIGEYELTKGGAHSFELTPFKARGIHLHYGIRREDAERILNQFKNTEMNAVVFDVKEDPGYILWDSQVPLAKQIGAYYPRTYTANDQVETCRTYKLYCIARVAVFKDKLLAQERPDLALHNAAGGLLYENSAYWTDPAEPEVQDYHIGLAQELAAMGFDEIQYDYIRYPGTQNVLAGEFGDAEYRVREMENFLKRSAEALRPTRAFFSGDVFGLTTAIDDEQGIGQVWENIAPAFDYISPMMYPSTWRHATNLWGLEFGINNCSDAYACAYEIMRYGTLRAQERTLNKWTLVRPWLQAYQMSLAQMLEQARGSDDANSAGYLFWNNAGVYPEGLFK